MDAHEFCLPDGEWIGFATARQGVADEALHHATHIAARFSSEPLGSNGAGKGAAAGFRLVRQRDGEIE